MADTSKATKFQAYYQFPGEVQEYDLSFEDTGLVVGSLDEAENIDIESITLNIDLPVYLVGEYERKNESITLRLGLKDDAKDGSKHVVYAVATNTNGMKSLAGLVIIVETIEAVIAASVEQAKSYERRLADAIKSGRRGRIAGVLATEPALRRDLFEKQCRVEAGKLIGLKVKSEAAAKWHAKAESDYEQERPTGTNQARRNFLHEQFRLANESKYAARRAIEAQEGVISRLAQERAKELTK